MSETTAADDADLRAELQRLRAENAALRGTAASAASTDPAPAPRRGRWRAIVSAVCIVVGGIIVPVSITAAWARTALVDENAFVTTFAPLAQDPGVQQVVIDQAGAAVRSAVDIPAITDAVFDGVQTLDLPPAALSALDLLRGPAASGLQSLVDGAVAGVVRSDAFSAVWQQTLVSTHRSLVAIATGSGDGAVSVDAQGQLGIQLAPIIEQVKSTLIAQGFGVAQSIPVVDRTIVIAQSDALPLIATGYTVAVAAGTWLPVAAAALLLIGVVTARRRTTALLGSGIALAAGALGTAAALAAGGVMLGLQAGSLGIPAPVLTTVYGTVTGGMADTAVVFALLGIVIAAAAWLSGRWTAAVRVRSVAGSLVTRARGGLRSAGLRTGRFGAWLYAQRLLVRIGLLVAVILVLLALRPLSLSDVMATAVGGLLLWLVAELLQAPPAEAAPDPDAGAPATAGTAGSGRHGVSGAHPLGGGDHVPQ